MIKLRTALPLILMILIGCSKQEMQPGQDALPYDTLKYSVSVPFKGNLDFYVYHIIHAPPPPPMEQLVHGSGKITHLGKSNITLHQYWWPPELPDEPYTGEGRVFFSAANGDILLAEYADGLAGEISPACTEITFTGYFKNGGSGRFEYAAGSFIFQGIYNPLTNEGSAVVDGEISYGKVPD